jgi:pimeloyl-ACP methyl ester carboxylesterase
MPALEIDGRTIAYEEWGDGEPILWLQGTGESRQGWAAQIPILAESFRCIATDHRDVGESSYVDDPYTTADLAADAAAVIDHLGTGPVHIVGFSLGGACAQELALVRPDLVRSLALLSTWAKTDPWFAGEMTNWKSIRRAHWGEERSFLDALGPWLWSPATYATEGFVDGLHTMMAAEDPPQRPEGWIRQCDADIAHDAAARLGAVTVPALVIVGEDDLCTPPRYAKELCALLPDAELLTIPDAGHGALAEKPDVVDQAIAGFFAKH